MFQKWENLLLLHWRIPKNLLDSTIPKELSVDLHDGDAWISVVGFRLTNLKIKPMVQIPWKDFNELNLRTYVRDQSGRKGVWFYSLDSTDLLAVLGARTLYGLNYRFASIEQTMESERIGYNSQTKFMQEPVAGEISAEFSKMNKSSKVAEPGGLDFFLLGVIASGPIVTLKINYLMPPSGINLTNFSVLIMRELHIGAHFFDHIVSMNQLKTRSGSLQSGLFSSSKCTLLGIRDRRPGKPHVGGSIHSL